MSIEGGYDYVLVDDNLGNNPLEMIKSSFNSGDFKYFCSKVMPSPQLKQAIPYTKKIKELYKKVITFW